MTKLHAVEINVDLSYNLRATKNVTLNLMMHDFALHFCKRLKSKLSNLDVQFSRNEGKWIRRLIYARSNQNAKYFKIVENNWNGKIDVYLNRISKLSF